VNRVLIRSKQLDETAPTGVGNRGVDVVHRSPGRGGYSSDRLNVNRAQAASLITPNDDGRANDRSIPARPGKGTRRNRESLDEREERELLVDAAWATKGQWVRCESWL
jgi:hypothetical protein